MKIAQVCPRYYPYHGGVETHVREISQRLMKRNFDIEVLTTDPSGKLPREEVIDGIKVKRFRSWAPNESYYFSRELKKYLMKNSDSFDIVHAHSYHAFPALYAAQAKKNNVFVFTTHYLGKGQTFFRNLLHIPYNFIAKKIFEKSNKVICVSKYEKWLLASTFKIENKKICVIPNGVKINELARYRWNPDFSQVKITFSGRLERHQKNVDKLIKSFGILIGENHIDAKLVIIGCGPHEKGLKRLVQKLKLENRVVWKGWLSRPKYLEELASSTVFVMPSEYECYGMAAAEAIVLGVPTVVANSAALSEFVEKRLALGISLPITPQKIANAVNQTITKQWKKQAQDHGILSWKSISEILATLYETLL
jgi:glycosyltransferase involved in cell wall biosynthesis